MASVRHLGLFPWCVNQETSFFKGDDLKTKAVPIWWRVKKWQISSVLVRQANTSPPSTETITGDDVLDVTSLTINPLSAETFQTETDLIRAGVLFFPEDGSVSKLPANHLWQTNFGIGAVDSYVKLGPDLEILFDMDDLVGVASNGPGIQLGNVTIDFGGGNFEVPLFALDTPHGGGLYTVISFEATLTPLELWSYDN